MHGTLFRPMTIDVVAQILNHLRDLIRIYGAMQAAANLDPRRSPGSRVC